jgi:hypothetical protein
MRNRALFYFIIWVALGLHSPAFHRCFADPPATAAKPATAALAVPPTAATPATAARAARAAAAWTLVAPPLAGQRTDVPLAAAGADGALFILGGRTHWGEYKKPRPYDVLRWNPVAREWLNEFPIGKAWGPATGNCSAPAWRDERFRFDDVDGNTRPNWTVYGTFSLGQKYGYDPDTRRFYFFAGGRTFSYDPATRVWTDLNPPSNPESELGGILLWSSLCYDAHQRRFLLFGGGNLRTDRGDPGTWSYSPSSNRWTRLELDTQPPPRANSRLAYDPVAKRVVLFGGDQLSRLVADTWTFDVVANRWEERHPSVSPAPRAGHAFVWLPTIGRLALIGGYTYSSTVGYCEPLYRALPLEVWLYDSQTHRWSVAGYPAWDAEPGPRGPVNAFWSAAVQTVAGLDRVSVLAQNGLWQRDFPPVAAGEPAEPGAAERGVALGTTVMRTGSYDPAWYAKDLPPADPVAVADRLKALVANRWTTQPTPKKPDMNMDWGSAVFCDDVDRIVRFSGGHSAYSGTAPVVYDVATDRYSLPFAPEMPIEYVYSNDQVSGEWSFQGRPWMTGHTYKSTGYDPGSRLMVFAPHNYTFFFDSTTGRWTRSSELNPYRPDFYNVTLCATPQGAVAWGKRRQNGESGLWRLNAATRLWQPLALAGELPEQSPDQHGMAYDSRRDRLLLFSNVGRRRGDVVEYSLSTGLARWLEPAGRQQATAPSRETIYEPASDAVLLAARVPRAELAEWLVYDCQRNEWRSIALAGDDPIGPVSGPSRTGGTSAGRAFNNSLGLMHDAKRGLIWAVGQYSGVSVLRSDLSAARPLQ